MINHALFIQAMYFVGIVIWLILWHVVNGYDLMRRRVPLLRIPFILACVVLLANLLIWSTNASAAAVELEEGLFNFLDSRTANVVSATASVLVIATIIYGVQQSVIPKDFLRYEAISFICFIGFATPLVWIPTNRPEWLMVLRHYQTIPFTYGLFFSVGGIIVLLESLGIELPEHQEKPSLAHMSPSKVVPTGSSPDSRLG